MKTDWFSLLTKMDISFARKSSSMASKSILSLVVTGIIGVGLFLTTGDPLYLVNVMDGIELP